MDILLVDDHALVREGLVLLLTQGQPAPRCAQAGTLAQALALAAQPPGFDLVLLDLDLPDSQGTRGVQALRERLPAARLVVLSAQEDPALVEACIEAGALGFVHKSAQFEQLQQALAGVVQGDIRLPAALLAGRSRAAQAPQLSARQLDVLRLLLLGASNKHIERELGLSSSTVKTHLAELFRRLEVSNRTQAVVAAAALGIRVSFPVPA